MLRFLSDPDLRSAFRAHRPVVIRGAFFAMGRALLGLAGPFLIGSGMDLVAARAPLPLVGQVVFWMLGFSLCTAFCQFWMRWQWVAWSREAERKIRGRAFKHLLTLPLPFFHGSRVGDLLSRLTSDVEAVRMGYGPGLMHAFQTGCMALGALILMLSRSFFLTLAAALPMLLLFLLLRPLLRRIHERSMKVQVQTAALSSQAQESFSGARVIKTFAREAFEIKSFASLSQEYVEDSVALARTRAGFRGLVELFGGMAMVAVLLVGGFQVVAGAISLGDYVAFNGFLQMLIWPAIALGWTLALFQRAEASEQRLQVIRREPAEVDAPKAPEKARIKGEIEVFDLTFTYPGRTQPALRGVSFKLEAGQTLGLVGQTGSGKSTLVQLLARLQIPPPGCIFLDGRPIESYPLDLLRGALACVPQESFLFSDSIAANVAFGEDSLSREALHDAARLACLDEDVAAFPEGFETLVGERGVTLSGGQRQRTALARAFARQAPILILDDALSAVDTETEQKILKRMQPLVKLKTTMIVSHRISSVMGAQQILVFDHGRVAEQGCHEELVAKGGLYARIHRLQREARELEQL